MAEEKTRRVKRGRPKMVEWRRKDYELRVMLDRVEYAYLAQEAHKRGLTLSELTRELINGAISSAPRVPIDPDDADFMEELQEDLARRYVLERMVSNMSAEAYDRWTGDLLGVEWVEVDDDGGES